MAYNTLRDNILMFILLTRLKYMELLLLILLLEQICNINKIILVQKKHKTMQICQFYKYNLFFNFGFLSLLEYY